MKTKEGTWKGWLVGVIGFLLAIAFIALTSCEKEEPDYNGTYYGQIEYRLTGFPPVTTARRIVTDHSEEAGMKKIHWLDAPDINCYTVVLDGEYSIWNLDIIAEPYCLGVKQKNRLSFCGTGKFIGDSLVEEGIVYHFTNVDTEYEQCESGTWRASFKRR